jgi:SAM-dependent methyltransferase
MAEKRENPVYVLGTSEREHQRLIEQSQFYGELTEELLRRAGIQAGMRVLDIGCGAGDVTLLVASLVGPTGSVIGIDRTQESIQMARARTAGGKYAHVTFLEGDILEVSLDAPVDAIVGRFVLLYLANPESALQRLCRLVRPGGLVIFHEMDMTTIRSKPNIPLCQLASHVVIETCRRGGVEVDMGSRLFATFCEAGLPMPNLILRARIEGRPDSPAYAYIANTLASLLPMAEQLGVTTAAEMQIDTFADRLREEVVRSKAVIVLPSLVGAWTRIPDDSSHSS